MAKVTKRVMATNGDTMGNSYSKFDGNDYGNGDGDGAKDTAACATTAERGMTVAMGHDLFVCLCVCGETKKNKAIISLENIGRYADTHRMVCKGFSFAHHLIFLSAHLFCKIVFLLCRYTDTHTK